MPENDGNNTTLNTQESSSPQLLSEIDTLQMRPFVFALLALLVIFFLYQVVGGGLTLLIFGQSVNKGNVQWMRLSTALAQVLFLFVPTLVLLRVQHGKSRSVFSWRIPKYSEVILALVGVLALQQVDRKSVV